MIGDIENMEGDVDILVIDNFIKDKEMLKELSDTTSEFWEKGFSWWGGWWNSPAETLRHRLIQYIWSTHCPTQFNGISTQGFEHWVGTYGPDEDWDNLNIHKDKDEEIALWEDKDALLSLFDSIKFSKLTIHGDTSLDYLLNLCDMWCAPEWISEDIKKRISENKNSKFKNSLIDNYIFKCRNCKAGFKIKDNTTPERFYRETIKSDSIIKSAYRSYYLKKINSLKAADIKESLLG